jgi:hypothetical protein
MYHINEEAKYLPNLRLILLPISVVLGLIKANTNSSDQRQVHTRCDSHKVLYYQPVVSTYCSVGVGRTTWELVNTSLILKASLVI